MEEDWDVEHAIAVAGFIRVKDKECKCTGATERVAQAACRDQWLLSELVKAGPRKQGAISRSTALASSFFLWAITLHHRDLDLSRKLCCRFVPSRRYELQTLGHATS